VHISSLYVPFRFRPCADSLLHGNHDGRLLGRTPRKCSLRVSALFPLQTAARNGIHGTGEERELPGCLSRPLYAVMSERISSRNHWVCISLINLPRYVCGWHLIASAAYVVRLQAIRMAWYVGRYGTTPMLDLLVHLDKPRVSPILPNFATLSLIKQMFAK
jgi:hypothetical protein